ncbi:MAG TPA: lysophospholipid acyltransferase family protein [Gaiellaceae bacterium]|nr:lysophospholipid acyltransferase family protein [Gaiellaceae bacterium]
MRAIGVRERWRRLQLAPDGRPRPESPFGRGPLAAHVLAGALAAGIAVGGRLPAGLAHRLAAVGGTLEWVARPAKRRRLAENLAHALALAPDDERVRRLVREEVVNEARRSADLLWALHRPAELLAATEVVGREHLERALADGRGVILASLHVGGWEVAAAIPAHVVPVPTTVVATDDWLAWAVQRRRVAAGLRVVFRSEPALPAASVLRRGEALLVLGELEGDAGSRRYAVRFLDGVAELQAGAAALARLCGSPIVPFSVLPLAPRRWRVTVEAPIAPPARAEGEAGERRALQALADRWTELVRRHPQHWAAVYPVRWLEAGTA